MAALHGSSGNQQGGKTTGVPLSTSTGVVGGTYKYQKYLAPLAGCPPTPLQPPSGPAFRFAKQPLTDPDNGLPVAFLPPRNALARKGAIKCCECYSLSLFKTLAQLRSRFKAITKSVPNFQKRVGDFYIELNLHSACGLCTHPNSTGHFSLFEFQGFSLLSAVVDDGPL